MQGGRSKRDAGGENTLRHSRITKLTARQLHLQREERLNSGDKQASLAPNSTQLNLTPLMIRYSDLNSHPGFQLLQSDDI
jgi:hypothetical protein